MKVLLLPVLLTSILNYDCNDKDIYYINTLGVEMTKNNYEKLIAIGYTKRELENITQFDFDNKVSMPVYGVKYNEYVLKTTKKIVDDTIISSENKIIDEEVAINEINEKTVSDIDYYTMANNMKSEDDYKKISIYGTCTEDQNGTSLLFVKVNVDWLKNPSHLERGKEGIAIKKENNVNLIMEIINGNSYPSFESTIMYKKTVNYYEYNYINPAVQNNSVINCLNTIKGNNIGEYFHSINDGILVWHNLPENVSSNTSEIGYIRIYEETYTDFFVTISATFTPNQDDFLSTEFFGVYAHQTNISIIGGRTITFIDEKPYVIIEKYGRYEYIYTNLGYDIVNTWPSC